MLQFKKKRIFFLNFEDADMAPKREQTALPTQREVTNMNDFAFWGLDSQEVLFVNLEKKRARKDSQKSSPLVTQ